MNRNEFLKVFSGVLTGLGISGMSPNTNQAQESESAGDFALDDSYLVKGLTAMVRAQGWFNAHWGAAVIAGYYLCKENRFDEATRSGNKEQLDTVIRLHSGQFAALPDESSNERRIQEIATALRPAMQGGLRAHGHAVIFASLSMRSCRHSPASARESGMRQVRVRGQGDLLALLEPVPKLPASARVTLVPMVAALLLEAAAAESPGTDGREAVTEREGHDAQDRA